jgi:NAD(P)-dependent dehydrogenase (short-subunit alcohol dehydrogenase family)
MRGGECDGGLQYRVGHGQARSRAVLRRWFPESSRRAPRHADDPQTDKDAYLATVPTGRWGRPDEVGWAAVYLASDEASFVTGQTIAADVGKTCW